MNIVDESLAGYVFMAWLGSVAYILIADLGWHMRREYARRMILAAIVGFLTYMAKLPNHLTSFGLGYFCVDALEAIVNKLKPAVEASPSG